LLILLFSLTIEVDNESVFLLQQVLIIIFVLRSLKLQLEIAKNVEFFVYVTIMRWRQSPATSYFFAQYFPIMMFL